MNEKMDGVYSILESFREKEVIDQEAISNVLEIQELAKELWEKDNNAINN